MKTPSPYSLFKAATLAVLLGGLSMNLSADTPSTSLVPEGWDNFVNTLETLPQQLLMKLPPEQRQDPQIQQEVARLVLQALAVSSLSAVGEDGDYPEFLPSISHILNVGQPNSDTLYRSATITPGGVYRLRGQQGSLTMAVIGQRGSEVDSTDGKRWHMDINTLQADKDGYFDVVLSTEKPAGYSGDWWPLHPKTRALMLRMVSSDWAGEQGLTIAIERLDIKAEKGRASAETLAQRLSQLPTSIGFQAGMFIDHVEQLRQEGYINKLKIMSESNIAGGLLTGQFYYEGVYDLADNEALIIEATHPTECLYRSTILTTELYQTTDSYNNHSSLNDFQSQPDKDGVLRMVVSAKDPGVPNWLDTAGHPLGVIQGRWTDCNSRPIPSTKKVLLEEVRDHLPADTPVVSAEERQEIIRERRAAYQQRIRW